MPDPINPTAGIVLDNPNDAYGLPTSLSPNLNSRTHHFDPPVDGDGQPSALAVRYAAPWGDDAASGLSWDDAFLTVLAAYDDLPAVNGGCIRFADQTVIGNEVANQGLWLAGSSDPNYASLPPGWRQVKALALLGEPEVALGQFIFGLASRLVGGSADAGGGRRGALIINGPNPGRNIEWYRAGFPAPILLNVDSDGNAGSDGVFATYGRCFSCTSLSTGDSPQPGLLLTDGGTSLSSGDFWHDWDNYAVFGNNAGTTAANRLAVDIVGWAIRSGRSLLTYGGMRYTNPVGTTWDFQFDWIETESLGAVDIPVIIAPGTSGNNSGGKGRIGKVTSFDAAGTIPAIVRIHPSFDLSISVGEIYAGHGITTPIDGPCVRLAVERTTPARNQRIDRQLGFGADGRLLGMHDGARRQAPLAAVPAVNTALDDPSSWLPPSASYGVGAGTATVTTGRTSPFGTTGAGKVEYAGVNNIAVREFVRQDYTLAVGDFLVFGGWVKVLTGGPYIGMDLETAGFTCSPIPGGSGDKYASAANGVGDGWEWAVSIVQVRTIGTNPCRTLPYTHLTSTDSMDIYTPMLIHLPAASFTAADAFFIANAALPAPSSVPVGSAALPYDIPLVASKFIGASRQILGPFTKIDFGGGGPTALDLANIASPNKVTAVRAGAITGLSVRVSEARTGGTNTVEVTKNGTGIGLTAVIDGTHTTFQTSTQAETLDTFVAGDQIGVQYTTAGPFTPTGTNDLSAFVEVIE